MGMIGYLLRIPNSELEAFLDDSSLLENKINGLGNDPCFLDVDKAWAGIFYLLTDCAMEDIDEAEEPLSYSFFSGQLVDEEQDLGMRPAHFVSPDQVKELHNVLSAMTVEDLKLKFNPEEMTEMEIYPQIWDEGDDAFSYLSDYFVKMKEFYQAAAEADQAVITYLS
jgi:hypothetical protein